MSQYVGIDRDELRRVRELADLAARERSLSAALALVAAVRDMEALTLAAAVRLDSDAGRIRVAIIDATDTPRAETDPV